MYEETGRQMRVLNVAVLEGVLADEADPLLMWTQVPSTQQGRVTHNFTKGSLSLHVELELENCSPTLPVHWILNLPQGSVYTGTLSRHGTLPTGSRASVKTHTWVCKPRCVTLSGWEVIWETGDAETDGEWMPCMNWISAGGGSVEVAAA